MCGDELIPKTGDAIDNRYEPVAWFGTYIAGIWRSLDRQEEIPAKLFEVALLSRVVPV
jgi:hypothetical protein